MNGLHRWICMGAVVVSVMMLGQVAQAQGSHFVAEVNNGIGIPVGYEAGYVPGYALGMTLGVGGKFKNNPTRFYLIGQFNTSSFSAERNYNNRLRFIDRQITDINGGLRMLWPLQKRLRMFVDLTLGTAQVDSEARTEGLPSRFVLRDTDTDFAVFAGGGLQYRLFYHFSLGAKADLAVIFDEEKFDLISDATSGESAGRTGRLNMYLTGTVHF